MSQFSYEGVDREGKSIKGILKADSEGEVRMSLRSQGVRPRKISPLQKDLLNVDIGQLFKNFAAGKVPAKVLVPFTRQLQVLISAGIPLVQSIEILAEGATDPALKAVLTDVSVKVAQGSYFWEAISHHPNAFPKIYSALVRAGESSGAMEQILTRLCKYMENTEKLKALLKGAMFYPVMVMVVGVGVISVMMIFVIPKFKEMLIQGGQELPGPTAFVMGMSDFIVNNFMFIFGGIGLAFFLLFRFLKTEEGQYVFDQTMFRMPLFGDIIRKGAVARFSRTMQTLLSSGVNLVDAVEICRSTIGNKVLEESMGKIRSSIEQGMTLGGIISKVGVFPKMAVQMISVGESSGSLDIMLDKIADYYEAEVEAMTAGLSKLVEPIMLVFMGGIVGGLLIAMYLPIFKMAGSAGG